MIDSGEAITRVRGTIQKHFPNASPAAVSKWADQIGNGSGAAGGLQWLERNDRPPDKDLAELKKAADKIEKAAKNLRAVGFQGGKCLWDLGQKVHQMQYRYNGGVVMSAHDTIEIIAQFLDGFSDEIRNCADGIDLSAATAMSELGIVDCPSARGRPKATKAYFAAREAACAYHEMAGVRCTVITQQHLRGNPAGGPFLEFLKDVFYALEMNESPETWARAVCKE